MAVDYPFPLSGWEPTSRHQSGRERDVEQEKRGGDQKNRRNAARETQLAYGLPDEAVQPSDCSVPLIICHVGLEPVFTSKGRRASGESYKTFPTARPTQGRKARRIALPHPA